MFKQLHWEHKAINIDGTPNSRVFAVDIVVISKNINELKNIFEKHNIPKITKILWF